MSSLLPNYGLIRKGIKRAALERIPVPKLLDDYVLVRTVAVAINPTDWTTLEAAGDDGTLVGCDFAGIVEEIGPGVTKILKKGDRVAGFAHGANDANPETGAFARYIICKGDLVMRVPDGLSWEAAATVAAGVSTVGQGLYKHMGLPLPDVEASKGNGAPILIYGGSTATGTIAIQFAKLSGRRVYTTCSPKHFELVKSYGADFVYDYHTPGVGDNIRADTQNQLTQVFDTVALESTAAICAAAFGPNGGLYVNLLGVNAPRLDVKSIFFLGYDASGESYIFEGETYPASPETFTFVREFLSIAEKLWDEGMWKPHPTRIGSAGLIGVLDGMKEMEEGKVRGEKLVYLVAETKFP